MSIVTLIIESNENVRKEMCLLVKGDNMKHDKTVNVFIGLGLLASIFLLL